MHSFAIADRVSKVKAFMLVVTATQPMNLNMYLFKTNCILFICQSMIFVLFEH